MSCVEWNRFYTSTMRRLEFYRMRVRQGVSVEDAQDFADYITQSGICDLMRSQPPQGDNPRHTERLQALFLYDGNRLYEEAKTLRQECCEYWVGRTRDAEGTARGASKSDLENINHKLALIAGRLAALETVKPMRTAKPRLKILKPKVA
jgi:hypothetical protein